MPHSRRILSLELAIVNGKVCLLFILAQLFNVSLLELGNHHAALSALVNDLHDSSSAEAYCTLGCDVIPMKVAQAVCTEAKLAMWVSSFAGKGRHKTVEANDDGAMKRELLKTLLQVYMTNECVLSNLTSHGH